MTTLAALAALGVVGLARLRPVTLRRPRPDAVDALLAARLVVLGLGAGLSVPGALAVAADESSGATARALRQVIHGARRGGLGAALGGADAALRPMLAVLVRAMASGAPVAAELAAHLREQERDRRGAALAAARALPVRLTVPLTLLVLPGCVLLLVGPALLESFASLSGGFLP